MGIGCTTGGDRSLADFFQVTVNKAGAAQVIWADTSNNGNSGDNQGALIDEAQQIGGESLYGTAMSGTAPVCTAVTSTACMSDVSGDARYEANGLIGNNVPKLDITKSSVNVDPADHTKLDVRMRLSDLSTLPSLTDTDINATDTTVDYLTSWNYHIPGNGQAQYDSTGNIYYAYLEVARGTGATSAYDGDTCSIATTHPKYLSYPGQNAITFHIDHTNGIIDLYVPLADVGNPGSGSFLYSVTAHTVGQAGPAGPDTTCNTSTNRTVNGGNNAGNGLVFDVYDKSPAYTSQLATPTLALLHGVMAVRSHQWVTFRWSVGAGSQAIGYTLLGMRGGRAIRLNSRLLLAHAARAYAFTARAAGMRSFYLQAVTRSGAVLFGPYQIR
jgi:hypothetical protein